MSEDLSCVLVGAISVRIIAGGETKLITGSTPVVQAVVVVDVTTRLASELFLLAVGLGDTRSGRKLSSLVGDLSCIGDCTNFLFVTQSLHVLLMVYVLLTISCKLFDVPSLLDLDGCDCCLLESLLSAFCGEQSR